MTGRLIYDECGTVIGEVEGLPPADAVVRAPAHLEGNHRPRTERACRVCGCTELSACVDADGTPCCWMDDDLCSACAGRSDDARRLALAAGHSALEAATELIRYNREGHGFLGQFEADVVGLLLDATKMAMEAECGTDPEREALYRDICAHLEGEVPS